MEVVYDKLTNDSKLKQVFYSCSHIELEAYREKFERIFKCVST